jgi:hypothetical protein
MNFLKNSQMAKEVSFEEFINRPEEIQRRLNSFPYGVWANQFNTTVEMIDRIVIHGENFKFQGINYEYDDVLADIVPNYKVENVKEKTLIALLCEEGFKVTHIWTEGIFSEETQIIDNRGTIKIISYLIPNTSTDCIGIKNQYRCYQLS